MHNVRRNTIAVAAIGLLLVGCGMEEVEVAVTHIFGPHPEVKLAEFHPEHFCSGDRIWFKWETEDIDKLELCTNNGTPLYTTTDPSGTGETPPIDADMVPLILRVYWGDEMTPKTVTELSNIDEPRWSKSYASVEEIRNRVWVDSEPFWVEDNVANPDGTPRQLNHYHIRAEFGGLKREIPTVDFSQYARIEAVQNLFSESLTLEIKEVTPREEFTLAPNEIGELQHKTHHPGRTIVGTYEEPRTEIVGEQIGEQDKIPPDPLFRIEWTYVDRSGYLRLKVFCEQGG